MKKEKGKKRNCFMSMEKEIFNFEDNDIFTDGNFKCVLSIVKRGFEGEVLEAAKSAGHYGAVVMQAKGVSRFQKRFFGFSVDPENTVVMMIVREDLVVPVMKAIYATADFRSEARGMIFALPVSLVSGMNESLEKIDID